jgi:predicted GIY-YIG superfamily endonuclease
MPNYQDGKIYKIVDNTNGDIYIGSSTIRLSARLQNHKQDILYFC